jgi:hypothetical protein
VTADEAGSPWRWRWMATAARASAGLIHHRDRGGQSPSLAFGQHLRAAGILPSTGSVGDCYDNAVAESFFATLQVERLHRARPGRRGRLPGWPSSRMWRSGPTASGATRPWAPPRRPRFVSPRPLRPCARRGTVYHCAVRRDSDPCHHAWLVPSRLPDQSSAASDGSRANTTHTPWVGAQAIDARRCARVGPSARLLRGEAALPRCVRGSPYRQSAARALASVRPPAPAGGAVDSPAIWW